MTLLYTNNKSSIRGLPVSKALFAQPCSSTQGTLPGTAAQDRSKPTPGCHTCMCGSWLEWWPFVLRWHLLKHQLLILLVVDKGELISNLCEAPLHSLPDSAHLPVEVLVVWSKASSSEGLKQQPLEGVSRVTIYDVLVAFRESLKIVVQWALLQHACDKMHKRKYYYYVTLTGFNTW